MPDARTGEPVDHVDAEPLRRPGRVFHVLDGPKIHAGRVAVAPDVIGQDRLMSLVDVVANRLADQVRTDGETLQVVSLQQFPLGRTVSVVLQSLNDFKRIAPASQLDAVVTELGGFCANGFKGHIGPLAGEESNGSRHGMSPTKG